MSLKLKDDDDDDDCGEYYGNGDIDYNRESW